MHAVQKQVMPWFTTCDSKLSLLPFVRLELSFNLPTQTLLFHFMLFIGRKQSDSLKLKEGEKNLNHKQIKKRSGQRWVWEWAQEEPFV